MSEKTDKEIEAQRKKEKEQGYYDVPTNKLRGGVTFRRVYGERPPEAFGKPPTQLKIIPLVE